MRSVGPTCRSSVGTCRPVGYRSSPATRSSAESPASVPRSIPAITRSGRGSGVAWIAGACGHCRFCRSGRENLCLDLQFTGWDRDGGYAERVTARADFTYALPPGFDDLRVAPLLCGGAIGHRSLRVAGIDPANAAGQRLGLFGFGASATCVIQEAVHLGCEVHVATRSAAERDRALALGATWVGGYDDPPPVPLDAAITFAPVGAVVVAALRAVDRGGTVAINAIHLDHIPELDYDDLWLERSLRSVANVTRADVVEFLAIAAEIPVETQIAVFPLDQADEVVQRLDAGDDLRCRSAAGAPFGGLGLR